MWFLRWLYISVFAFLSSSVVVKTKQVMITTYDPLLLIVLRYLFVFLIYKIVNIIFGYNVSVHNKKTFLLTCVGGILLLSTYYLLVTASVLLPISIYSGILSLTPICSTVLGIVLLSETLSYSQVIGFIIIFFGALIPLAETILVDNEYHENNILLGTPICIIGIICNSLWTILLRFSSRYMVEQKYADFGRQIVQNTSLIAGVLAFIVSLITIRNEEFSKQYVYATQTEVILSLLEIAGISAIHGNFNLYLIKRFPLSFMAILSSFSIVPDSLLSHIILGETINPMVFVSLLISTAGLAVYLSGSSDPVSSSNIKTD